MTAGQQHTQTSLNHEAQAATGSWAVHSAWVIALAVCVLSLTLTWGIWLNTKNSISEVAGHRFDTRVAEIHGALEARLLAYAQALKGAQVYIGETGNTTRAGWGRLYRTLRLENSYPGFVALVYIRAVAGQDLASVLAEERRHEPDLTMYPPGERDFHAVVTAIEPRSPQNILAIGADSWASPPRQDAMIRARDSGDTHITPKVQLVIDRGVSIPSFLMYQSVYRHGALPGSQFERRQQLQGFVVAAVRLQTLIEGVFPAGLHDVAFQIYDNGDATPSPDTLYYSSHPQEHQHNATFRVDKPLVFGGRTWRVTYASRDMFIPAMEREQPNRVLWVGGLISLLLMVMVWSLLSGKLRAIRLAQSMTRSLRENEGKLRALVAQAPLGIFSVDRDGTLIDCNDKAVELLGSDGQRIIGFNFFHDAIDQSLTAPIRRAIHGIPVTAEISYRSTLGGHLSHCQYHFQPVYLDGEFLQVLCFLEDISARKEAEGQLAYLAHHDALTGLGNRPLLHERLVQAIAAAEEAGQVVCLVFLDLDNFKTVNDTLGHTVGDALLVEVAQRLYRAAPEETSLCRIGGDEFVLVLPGLTAAEDAIPLLDKLLAEISHPLDVLGHTLSSTASMGVACWPRDGLNPEQLNLCADIAMYHAKNVGRATYRFYDPEMSEQVQADARLEKDLRRALEHNEFRMVYQPQLDARTGELIGAEALIRWQPPGQGMVPPDRFIPFAEERGLIVAIGDWVLRAVCRQLREWRDQGGPHIPVAINLSAKQFKSGLPGQIAAVLAEFALEPSALVLEVTESTVMEDPASAAELMHALVSMGLHIEIDDFGTGYSSLSSLKHYPIHRLKIDRSFVSNVPQDVDDVAIVDAILQVAGSLEIAVIAEGVESAEQVEHLVAHGCHAMQGYYFARPLPAEGLRDFWQQHS